MSTYRIDGIKYNPANWAGLAPCERAACNRFAAARERELNTITATPWTCDGGPFAGSVIELESTTDRSAPMTVGGWMGHYELVTCPKHIEKHGTPSHPGDAPRVLKWLGTVGAAPVNTHGCAGSDSKAAPEVTGKGFDLLTGLLAELAEDPAERATSSPLGPRARYNIGRTSFFIAATPEATEKLRARLIKAKKWFSDKMIGTAGVNRTTEAIPDIAAASAATLAIAQAQASAATATPAAHQADTAEACGGLVTCDGPDNTDTAEATPCADTPADLAQAIAEAHTPAADEPDHYTDPLKTCAQAQDYTGPLKTQANPAMSVQKQEKPNSVRIVIRRDELIGDKFEVQGVSKSGKWEKQTTFDSIENAKSCLISWGYNMKDVETMASEWNPKTKRFSAPAPAHTAPIEAPALPEVAAEPSDNTPPKNGTGFAQQASSKLGAWVAALYRDTQGAHVLRFDLAGMGPVFHSFKTRGTMLASLQALGSAADRGHLAHFLNGFSVLDSSGAEVRSMAPAIFQALRDHLEDINYHTEALMLSCFRAGRDDLAAGVAHLVRFQAAPGYEGLPSDMAEARAAVSRVLRGEAPGPISPEAAARLAEWGLSLDPAPTPPAPRQADTPPGVGGAAHPILESAPAFTKVAPFSLDPCTILQAGVTAEQLVGLGVVYLGNAANASGEGAITSATESRQFGDVQMVCTLEDGRVINASRYSFTGEVRPIFQFNGKMHGAPYLAQLSAVRAALKAQHSSAQAIKEAEHARQLETLAAEFPQLERHGKNSAGKLAAINIRKLLKTAFKAVKFSVTSDYNSARVSWEDGPTAEQVNAVIGRFDIGHSDCNSDYFYTTETAWSQLFGGVQYLTTSRSTSDTMVSSAIAQAFSGASLPEDATPKAWRNASGAFSWNTDSGQMYSRRVREILSKTAA